MLNIKDRPPIFKGMRACFIGTNGLNCWITFTCNFDGDGSPWGKVDGTEKFHLTNYLYYPEMWRLVGEEGCPPDPKPFPPISEWKAGDKFWRLSDVWHFFIVEKFFIHNSYGELISLDCGTIKDVSPSFNIRWKVKDDHNNILWVPRENIILKPTPKYNTKCNSCGADGFQLFSSIECSNSKCKNFKDQ